MSSQRSAVLTFLFTDIEGSTRRWEADADAMQVALEAHDETLRQAIARCGGRVFKHTGDGICAAFGSPHAAVDAAVVAQRCLELPVRMGIATGEAQERGNDYFGPVLNRAARVMSAGHGGQILVDGLTAGLLSGIDLAPLGERRLRDIAKPVAIYQVSVPGLRMDFPPLRAVDPAAGNLRRASNSFVGREVDVTELTAAVASHRLVTLIGVGGVGKTRLALETAAQLVGSFPDGVWVIELASISDPVAIPEAVSAVLGITQQPGMTMADSVASALEGRSRLLVFDNCEHVLDAAADLIDRILARSPTVRVLATSREGLRVSNEQLWPVPSLDVSSTAATLFVERALSVAPGAALTAGDTAVIEICRRLDGIPLAIELAASRMQSMTVSEIWARLDDRFRLLVGSRRGLERHQTLRHAVQWSFDLLDDAEKFLLAGCSVFAGGFDLAGACAVSGSSDEFAVLDLLDALVRKSLLVADKSSEQTRFSMLETIRQFAEEQLIARGEADLARNAHAKYFAGWETELLALWNSPRQREAFAWFTVELANLRTAFRWAADQSDLDTAAAIAVYACPIGNWLEQHEPNGWAEALVEPARAVGHPRLAQLYVHAAQCALTGRIEEALGYAEAGLAAIASGRYDPVPFGFEAFLGSPYLMGGRPEIWVQWCRDTLAREQGAHTFAHIYLVQLLAFTEPPDEAMAAADGLLAIADESDNPSVVCFALIAYGSAYAEVDPVAAYDILRRGLTIAQHSGNRQFESHFALNLSRLAVNHGDPVDAIDFLTLAIRNHYDSGSFSFLRAPLTFLAAYLTRLGRHRPAATIIGFAADPFTRAAFPDTDNMVAQLRGSLGDEEYVSLARTGEAMTAAAVVTYAYDQIDEARAELMEAD